jgi:hypothetical protein
MRNGYSILAWKPEEKGHLEDLLANEDYIKRGLEEIDI